VKLLGLATSLSLLPQISANSTETAGQWTDTHGKSVVI